jgi:Mrp family chromosome partitioning ATPase
MIADTPKVDQWTKASTAEVPEALAALASALEKDAAATRDNSSGAPRPDRFLALHEVPQLPLDEVRPVFPILDAKFPIAWKQQIRQVRTRVNQMQVELASRKEQSLQVVSVSSLVHNRPRHGLAANLGYMLATMQECRVLVVDARVGQPGIAEAAGWREAPGLCEATRLQREQLPQCLRRVNGSQLFLMPSGQADAFGFDPIDLKGLHLLLHGLRQHFDWIVVDAPSFDSPADAMLMSQCADGTLFVIEREKDTFAAMSRALGETQGRYLLGAVLV